MGTLFNYDFLIPMNGSLSCTAPYLLPLQLPMASIVVMLEYIWTYVRRNSNVMKTTYGKLKINAIQNKIELSADIGAG